MRAESRMWVVAGDGPSQAHVVLSPTCHKEKINRARDTGPESIAKPEMRPEAGGDEWAWLQGPRHPQALWGRGPAFLEGPAVICRETSVRPHLGVLAAWCGSCHVSLGPAQK